MNPTLRKALWMAGGGALGGVEGYTRRNKDKRWRNAAIGAGIGAGMTGLWPKAAFGHIGQATKKAGVPFVIGRALRYGGSAALGYGAYRLAKRNQSRTPKLDAAKAAATGIIASHVGAELLGLPQTILMLRKVIPPALKKSRGMKFVPRYTKFMNETAKGIAKHPRWRKSFTHANIGSAVGLGGYGLYHYFKNRRPSGS